MQEIHDLQRQIITKLLQKPLPQRYSELQIPGVDNDLFNYHLQILVKKEFLTKKDSHYQLSERGKQFASKMNAQGIPQQLFKNSVALAVFRNNYTELLVQKRLRSPFYGDLTTVAGKIALGESIASAARRKLLEETNLAAQFTFIGVLRSIKRNSRNEILEDTFYHYCVAQNPVGVLQERNEFGENYWMTPKDFLANLQTNQDYGPEDTTVWKRICKRQLSPFIIEQEYLVKHY